MTLRQKKLFIFFSLYFLIISNSLNVFINNFEYHFTINVLSISIILFIVLLLLSYTFIFLFKRVSKNIFFYFFLILFYFICLISAIHPNIPSPGENLKFIFFINLIIAFLLTIITIKFKIYNFFIITSFVTILVSTIYFSIILYEKYSNQNKNFSNDNFLISKKFNVFVISFDNIPSHIMEDEFKRNRKKSYLDDFVFFNKFIGGSQSTHGNIIFEIYGDKLQDNSKKTESDYINELKHNPNNFINFINKDNINTNFYGRYNSLIGKDELLDFIDIELFERITLTFHRYVVPSLERLFTYKLRLFYNKHIGNKYLWEHKQSLEQFEKFIKSINDSSYTEDVVINFGHWYFSHYPISLNENCQFVQNLPKNASQMINVAKCSMKLFEEFINTLKSKRIYKNSIVIFKSDSGIYSSFYPDSEILSLSKNNSNYGYSMYRPFLMVKSLNSNRFDKINESIISIFDLANYYCNELNKFIGNKSEKNSCKLLGNEDLYNALYLNKITSNKKINILFDDGMNTHLMSESIFKTVNIIDGNIDESFVRVFSD